MIIAKMTVKKRFMSRNIGSYHCGVVGDRMLITSVNARTHGHKRTHRLTQAHKHTDIQGSTCDIR